MSSHRTVRIWGQAGDKKHLASEYKAPDRAVAALTSDHAQNQGYWGGKGGYLSRTSTGLLSLLPKQYSRVTVYIAFVSCLIAQRMVGLCVPTLCSYLL